MLTLRLWEIVPTGCEPEVLTYLEQLVSHGRSTMQTVFLARDGHPIDVEIHATALFERVGGGLVHSRAFVRDISERRRLEQQIHRYTTQLELAVNERTRQLVASQERYKALFDLVADSVFMIDAEGMVVAVNKREEQALGYAEERVVGQNILQVVSSAHRDDMVALVQKVSGGQRQVPTQEITVRDAKGKETPAEMDLILVGDSDRPLIMVQLRDITDRKRLERQMQTYQQELQRSRFAREPAKLRKQNSIWKIYWKMPTT